MLHNIITAKLNKSVEELAIQFKDFDVKECNSLFNKCVIVAHLHGIDIPSYECEKKDKEGNIVTYEVKEIKGYDNELSYSEVAEKVGKSKATCVLYGKTIEALIDNKVLGLFANGSVPFNMNKVRMILDNKSTLIDDKHSLEDLMHYSEDSVKAMLNNNDDNKDDKDAKSNKDDKDDKPIDIIIKIGNVEHELRNVPTSAIDKLLEKYEVVEAEEEEEA